MFPATTEYGVLGARMSGNLETLFPTRKDIMERLESGGFDTPSYSVSPAIKKIDKLDLTQVKKKLCFPEEHGGKGWTPEQADAVEIHYKGFLKECLTNKDTSPDSDVDDMFHAHILFTEKYHRDCQAIFGHYLHHLPNLEMSGDKCKSCAIYCSCNSNK